MHESAQAAITSYTLGGFNNRHLLPPSLKAGSPRSRCQQGLFLWRPLLLSCCCAHKTYTLYAHGVAGRSLVPLLIRAPILSSQSPTLMTSISLNYILWTPSPYTVTLGVRASTNKFWGDTIPSIAISLTMRTDSRHLNAFLRLPLFFSLTLHQPRLLVPQPNLQQTLRGTLKSEKNSETMLLLF